MGEEQKMACGTLWVATEGGEPVKLCNFDEVETYSDEENDDYRAILYSHEDISAPIEASFTIPPQLWPRLRKFFSGFEKCKGPARYSQIFKHDKMIRKRRQLYQKVVRAINHMIADTGTGIVNDYPVNITGLPCTDIYEWVWFIVDPAAYSEYRDRKIQRTARSKRRSQRR